MGCVNMLVLLQRALEFSSYSPAHTPLLTCSSCHSWDAKTNPYATWNAEDDMQTGDNKR